ncbi:MAG: polysaccharide biosynthesis/export family protein [Planctomycetota bacterium]
MDRTAAEPQSVVEEMEDALADAESGGVEACLQFIRIGQTIEIQIVDVLTIDSEYTTRVVVGADGTAHFEHLGVIRCAGMQLSTVERQVHDLLKSQGLPFDSPVVMASIVSE